MAWARLQGRVSSFRPPKKKKTILPATVFEIQSGFVMGARLSRTRRKVNRLAVREFNPEALGTVSCLSNVSKPEELNEAVRAVEAALGGGKGPLALLVPDPVVRISILEFETLPSDAKDRENLIRWKMKPLLPFASEEARLSFEVSHQEPGRIEVMAMAARNSVLAEYESAVEALSGEVSLVLPVTFALLPLLSENTEEGELLLHVCPGGLTAVMVGGGRIRLWRSQAVQWTSPEECLNVVSQEAARVLAGAQDHLGLEIGRVSLCVRPPVPEEWVAELGRAIARQLQVLIAEAAGAAGISADESELLRYFGVPFAGLLANAS